MIFKNLTTFNIILLNDAINDIILMQNIIVSGLQAQICLKLIILQFHI